MSDEQADQLLLDRGISILIPRSNLDQAFRHVAINLVLQIIALSSPSELDTPTKQVASL